MPGWYFPVESATTRHQMYQFKMAIAGALKSDYNTRAKMRSYSARQRYPVQQWKEDLEILQATSIKVHREQMIKLRNRRLGIESGTSTPSLPGWLTPNLSGWNTPSGNVTPRGSGTPAQSRPGTRPSSPSRSATATALTTPTMSRNGSLSLGMRYGPGHTEAVARTELNQKRSFSLSRSSTSARSSEGNSLEGSNDGERKKLSSIEDSEEYITSEQAEEGKRLAKLATITQDSFNIELRDGTGHVGSALTPLPTHNGLLSATATPGNETPISTVWLAQSRGHSPTRPEEITTQLTEKAMKEEEHFQDLTPFFTDPTGLYYKAFDKMLEDLSGKTSEGTLCIEEYLAKSEKQWFHRLHLARMARLQTPQAGQDAPNVSFYDDMYKDEPMSQFLLPQNYAPPTGMRRWLNYKLGDWPIYSFLLALGQILAANSYQITLLTGQQGQTATQLYVIASIYLASTLLWWFVFRRFACVYALSIPWFFYGLAFFLLGFAPYAPTIAGRGWVQNVATAMYAIASASGSLFFAQNFSEGACPVKTWSFRACAIQGTQQIYVIGLWAWGDQLTRANTRGYAASTTSIYGWPMTAIGVPIALFLWTIGVLLLLGLPEYYRQRPGAVPSFYSAVFRRKVVIAFFVMVFVQNFFLSAPYGRNWSYLWSSQHAPAWTIVLLIIFFFVIIWIAVLYIFGRLSEVHSWILPMFAVALGAPRWAQIWWAISNIGTYLPWAGSPLASALLGRSLWLWLGLLDSLQGVGIGMLLLQTLTRFHISFALMFAQVIGSIATIIARADGLSSVGPLPYFPSPAAGAEGVISSVGFWICLLCNIAVMIGYFAFFRKEQLSKP